VKTRICGFVSPKGKRECQHEAKELAPGFWKCPKGHIVKNPKTNA